MNYLSVFVLLILGSPYLCMWTYSWLVNMCLHCQNGLLSLWPDFSTLYEQNNLVVGKLQSQTLSGSDKWVAYLSNSWQSRITRKPMRPSCCLRSNHVVSQIVLVHLCNVWCCLFTLSSCQDWIQAIFVIGSRTRTVSQSSRGRRVRHPAGESHSRLTSNTSEEGSAATTSRRLSATHM